MIDFEKIKLDQSQPIYSQLVDFVKQGLASGEIEAGDEMPSRRVLSALLGINPNTVQKAYAQLEAEELISSHSGAKSYVSATEGKVAEVKAELTVDGGKQAIAILKAAGYSKAEALAALERYWDADATEVAASAEAAKCGASATGAAPLGTDAEGGNAE